jgi:hypothetical protein
MIKPSLKKQLLILLLMFLTLLIARLVFGYVTYPDGYERRGQSFSNISDFSLDRKNYASNKTAKGSVNRSSTTAVDQKYEKVGSLANITEEYEKNEKALYTLIKDEALMIQLEQKSGLSNARTLNIALGVIPDKFDMTIEQLKKIGTVKRIQIDKKDKTNEYKKLEAKRVSLQKARESLMALKQVGGDVKDMIELTNRLLVIENDIQGLGVSLGEFDENNEFCTVKFILKEVPKATYKTLSLTHRLHVAAVWTTKVFLSFWAMVVMSLLGFWLIFAVGCRVMTVVRDYKHEQK